MAEIFKFSHTSYGSRQVMVINFCHFRGKWEERNVCDLELDVDVQVNCMGPKTLPNAVFQTVVFQSEMTRWLSIKHCLLFLMKRVNQ